MSWSRACCLGFLLTGLTCRWVAAEAGNCLEEECPPEGYPEASSSALLQRRFSKLHAAAMQPGSKPPPKPGSKPPPSKPGPPTPTPAPLPVVADPEPPPGTAPSPPTHEYPHSLMTQNCPNFVLQTTCMTKDMYEAVSASVAGMLNSISGSCDATDCPQADWAGCVLRMAGHDFMDRDPESDSGGSDGCTDMNNADNGGLAACLHGGEHGHSLQSAYEISCSSVSLADFLVIAAESVMTVTRGFATGQARDEVPLRGNFWRNFKFGRTTATTCESAAEKLPNPENGCPAVQETFIERLGLNWRGAAALMGVHSLGRAKLENSGYFGWWSDPENSRKFNNNYYVSMIEKGWEPEKALGGNEEKNMWIMTGPNPPSGDATEMMLDTDLCLAYNIPDGAAGSDCCAWLARFGARNDLCQNTRGGVDCGGSVQELTGAAAEDVMEFSRNEMAWLTEFQAAWARVTSAGFPNLSELVDTC